MGEAVGTAIAGEEPVDVGVAVGRWEAVHPDTSAIEAARGNTNRT